MGEPGASGIKADWDSGLITNVEPGGQADRLGVKSGWAFFRLDDSQYTEQRFDALLAGTRSFPVTFITATPERVPLTFDWTVGSLERPSIAFYPAALACVVACRLRQCVLARKEVLRMITPELPPADGNQEHAVELAAPASDKSGARKGEPILKPHGRLPAIVAPTVPPDAAVAPNIPLRQFPDPETLGRQTIPAFHSL